MFKYHSDMGHCFSQVVVVSKKKILFLLEISCTGSYDIQVFLIELVILHQFLDNIYVRR